MYLLVIEPIALRLENQLHYHSLQLSREQAVYYSEVPNQNKDSTTIFKGYKTYPPEHQNASYFPVFKSQGLYSPPTVNSIQILFKGSQRQTPTI